MRLLGARVDGQLNLSGAELTNQVGLALDLQGAEAKQVFRPARLICSRAVAGRSACSDATRRVNLAGFVYTTHDGDWRRWLHMIARYTDQYWPSLISSLPQSSRSHRADPRSAACLIRAARERVCPHASSSARHHRPRHRRHHRVVARPLP